MFKKLFTAIFMYLAAGGISAQAQTFPTDWYWQVAGSSPLTQVWKSSTGAFVGVADGGYATWLTNLANAPGLFGQNLAYKICGDANNGSGAHRITICNPPAGGLTWSTGQIKTVTGVTGSTGVNVTTTITVVDQVNGIVDLQGTTFGGTYTPNTGVIGAGYLTDTTTSLNTFINSYNLQLATGQSAIGSGSIVVNSGGSVNLTNPLNRTIIVSFTGAGLVLTLPQMNLFGSMPIGFSLYIANTGSNSFTLKDFLGSTIATVLVGQIWQTTLIDNTTQAGGTSSGMYFVSQPNCSALANAAASCSTDTTNAANISSGNLPAARLPAAGVNCPSGVTAGTVVVVNGQVTHC